MDSALTLSQPESIPYDDKPAIAYATKVAVQAGGAGTLLAALQRVVGPPLIAPGAGFWATAGRNVGLFGAPRLPWFYFSY